MRILGPLALLLSLSASVSAQTASDHLQRAQQEIASALSLLAAPVPVTHVDVPSGGNVQAAIDSIAPGTTILLAPRGTYAPFILRHGPGTIMTAGVSRVDRATRETSSEYAVVTAAGDAALLNAGHGWNVIGVTFAGLPTTDTVIRDGTALETSVAQLPSGLRLDRIIVQCAANGGTKRGIGLNGINSAVLNSSVYDCKRPGQDTQAIAGWNGPGPYELRNNYLEGAGENVMFGGSDPRIPGLVPSDILILDNHLTKPLHWRSQGWLEKNLLELKNAQRVRIEGNLLENSWADGQDGYGIVLTPRNQDGACGWCVLRDIEVGRNIIRHVGAGISILGRDDIHTSLVSENITIADNVFEDISASTWGGAARQFLINGGPVNLKILRNVVKNTTGWMATALSFGQPQYKLVGLEIVGNTLLEGEYGIHGQDAPALGKAVLDFYAPGYVWSGNTIIRGSNWITYPSGTTIQ